LGNYRIHRRKGDGNMTFDEMYLNMELKFTSGNDIPVERAIITREEWELIKAELNRLDEMEI
jgi:hypothetical protein